MEFFKTSKAYYLTKSTYINLRWISIIGQFVTINSVKFIFNFEFNYLLANFIIFLGILFILKEDVAINIFDFT